jgi:hypothetical protein
VILSPWFDCHDFGVRAEWLGIGKWGNKRVACVHPHSKTTLHRPFLVSGMEAKQHGVSARTTMSKRSRPRSSRLWAGRPAI